MNLEDLDIFRCVVREGGVTRAASQLHRVPSNVTTRIKQFEARLGVTLFKRQGRGLVLTDAGPTNTDIKGLRHVGDCRRLCIPGCRAQNARGMKAVPWLV